MRRVQECPIAIPSIFVEQGLRTGYIPAAPSSRWFDSEHQLDQLALGEKFQLSSEFLQFGYIPDPPDCDP